MRPGIIGLLGLTVALALTGCRTEAPPVTLPTPIETSTPSATPTTEPPAAFDATCETIVTQATLDGFAADGVSITPQADFVAKMQAEGQTTFVLFDTNGGAICQTGNGTAAFEIYGYAVFTAAQSSELVSTLYDNGFQVDGYGDAEGQWFELPADTDGVDRVYLVLTDGRIIVGGSRDRVEEILATVPG